MKIKRPYQYKNYSKAFNRILFILIFLNGYTQLNGQQLEIDLSFGYHLSKSKFHHSGPVDTDDDKTFDNFGSNYTLGLTSSFSKNWKLRTELGFVLTNSFFSIGYKFDEGFGETSITRISWLNNQKIYLGVFPEYRLSLKGENSFVFFNGGFLFSSDIANNLSTSNQVLLPDSTPSGLMLGSGFMGKFQYLGFKATVRFVQFGKSKLFNIHHPYISYRQLHFSLGIIYNIEQSEKSE